MEREQEELQAETKAAAKQRESLLAEKSGRTAAAQASQQALKSVLARLCSLTGTPCPCHEGGAALPIHH